MVVAHDADVLQWHGHDALEWTVDCSLMDRVELGHGRVGYPLIQVLKALGPAITSWHELQLSDSIVSIVSVTEVARKTHLRSDEAELLILSNSSRIARIPQVSVRNCCGKSDDTRIA